jgi:hypothetical protein
MIGADWPESGWSWTDPSGDRPAQTDNLGWSEPGGSAGPR